MLEFVMRGGQGITAGKMAEFRRKLPFLKVKAETIDAPNFPHLREQILFLTRYTEDVLDGVYDSEDLTAVAESVFGLGYLLQDVDIIPDSVPEMGYVDDSAVIRTVLAGHQEEFRKFAAKTGLDLAAVTYQA